MSNENNIEQDPHNPNFEDRVFNEYEQTANNEVQISAPGFDNNKNEDFEVSLNETEISNETVDENNSNELIIEPDFNEYNSSNDFDSAKFEDTNFEDTIFENSKLEDSMLEEPKEVIGIDEELEEELTHDLEISSEEKSVIPVNITILNEDYTIFCPQGDEDDLHQATADINEFIDGLREEAPMLSPKNLLVLACLNLYEKMTQARNAASTDADTLQHASSLVSKMIEDMKLDD